MVRRAEHHRARREHARAARRCCRCPSSSCAASRRRAARIVLKRAVEVLCRVEPEPWRERRGRADRLLGRRVPAVVRRGEVVLRREAVRRDSELPEAEGKGEVGELAHLRLDRVPRVRRRLRRGGGGRRLLAVAAAGLEEAREAVAQALAHRGHAQVEARDALLEARQQAALREVAQQLARGREVGRRERGAEAGGRLGRAGSGLAGAAAGQARAPRRAEHVGRQLLGHAATAGAISSSASSGSGAQRGGARVDAQQRAVGGPVRAPHRLEVLLRLLLVGVGRRCVVQQHVQLCKHGVARRQRRLGRHQRRRREAALERLKVRGRVLRRRRHKVDGCMCACACACVCRVSWGGESARFQEVSEWASCAPWLC